MVDESEFDMDVPLPARGGPRRSSKIHEIPINGSHVFRNRTVQSVAPQVWKIARATGKRFRTAKVEGGVRVWRIE